MNGFFPASTVHRNTPTGIIPKCGSCGLFKSCQSPKMKPFGKGKKRILVVGEAPGENEDAQGRPFVGQAGRFLRERLEALDIDLDEDAWTTNALICHPPHNATPDSKQIEYCHPNLIRTLRELQPHTVITLGRVALASILKDYWGDIGTLDRWVGWQIPLEIHWVCPTYHPSYLLRMKNPVLDRMFTNHLGKAFSHQKTPPPQPDWKKRIEILLDVASAVRAIQELEVQGGWVAVDYETTCLKPEWPRGQIITCALSNGTRTISYPWLPKTEAATGELLRSATSWKIASNLKMEQRWTLKTFGHGVRNWGWDTMLATHCLDNRTGICSLKFQSLVRLGVPVYNSHIDPFLDSSGSDYPYNRIKEIDLHQLLFYGGMDALLEYVLARKQRRDLGYDPI